jgi:GTP-binding nuclear protein Ran
MEFKVALVGPKSAGKTTFLKRLQTGKFDEEYKPTIGYQDHNLAFNSNIGEVRFSVRDCGFEILSFVRDVDGVIVMDDISIENTYYNNIKNFHNNIRVVNCHNDKSGNRVGGYDGRTCFISVKMIMIEIH